MDGCLFSRAVFVLLSPSPNQDPEGPGACTYHLYLRRQRCTAPSVAWIISIISGYARKILTAGAEVREPETALKGELRMIF